KAACRDAEVGIIEIGGTVGDIEAGRAVGAATVSVLHANPVYVAQMAYARREVASARERGTHSPQDCAVEARALAEGP
ncbi:MAG TPA: hypothetical protein VF038_09465, partial [Usitatibacter sp.]